MIRKIRRNKVKREVGSNRIRRKWRNLQIETMGLIDWVKSYNRCVAKSKPEFKNKKTAYVL